MQQKKRPNDPHKVVVVVVVVVVRDKDKDQVERSQ